MRSVNFTAFDFETANRALSACQLGIVVVREGNIVEEKLFYIQPPNNYFEQTHIKIHGITPSDTIDKPTFGELWPDIKHYFERQLLVFHAPSNDVDLLVLDREMEHYNIPEFPFLSAINTLYRFDAGLKSRSLKSLCNAFDISMENHHSALSDARCCAHLFMKYLKDEKPDENKLLERRKKKPVPQYNDDPNQKISSETKKQDLSIVENPNTIFYDKKVVISGTFERYPVRDDLGLLLKKFGADINSTISGKTNIFIVGSKCGPKKLEKVFNLMKTGIDIQIIEETQLHKILDEINHG